MNSEPTIPEKEGWIDRSKLLAISGRSRKSQILLAAEKDIRDYPCPAGGCLLTDKNFADKMRDYFTYTEHPSIGEIALLKVGRHFRLANGDKVIVARNDVECKMLKNFHRQRDHLLVPLDFPGPSVILQGNSLHAAVEKIAQYTKGTLQKTARITHLNKGKNKIICLGDFDRK